MSKMIALAGKGGTGKTTVSALMLRQLIDSGRTPVFAVDADPNYTLAEALGVTVEQTIGAMREDFFGERDDIPAGMSREAVLERAMNAALHEFSGYDLLVMGRQEGPGCYCYLNNILRRFLDTLAADYPYVLVDNEAGMEHLSRRTTRKVDLMLVVADHTIKGARAADRIAGLVEELKLDVQKIMLIVNRAPETLSDQVQAEIARSGLELLTTLPDDEAIRSFDASGRSLLELPEDNPVAVRLHAALEPIISTL